MKAADKLFLMLDDDHAYGQLVRGTGPETAVEAHYAALDAWCAPSPDAELSEEFLVRLYEVPSYLEAGMLEQFEKVSEDLLPEQVVDIAQVCLGITAIEINVTYSAEEGAKASQLPDIPRLFSSRGED